MFLLSILKISWGVERDAGGEGFGVFAVVGEVNIVVRLGKFVPLAGGIACPEAHGAFVVHGGDGDFHEVWHGVCGILGGPSREVSRGVCDGVGGVEADDIAGEDFGRELGVEI